MKDLLSADRVHTTARAGEDGPVRDREDGAHVAVRDPLGLAPRYERTVVQPMQAGEAAADPDVALVVLEERIEPLRRLLLRERHAREGTFCVMRAIEPVVEDREPEVAG